MHLQFENFSCAAMSSVSKLYFFQHSTSYTVSNFYFPLSGFLLAKETLCDLHPHLISTPYLSHLVLTKTYLMFLEDVYEPLDSIPEGGETLSALTMQLASALLL